MMSPAEARAAMLAAFKAPGETERVALDACLGRTLAEDVNAARDQPPFAASAMDGYALRAADTPGRLRMIGESAAGRGLTRALGVGEAARIFTGAPVPEGADSVLIQEEAQREGDALIAPKVEAGANVRPRGIDFESGTRLLSTGAILDGIAIAFAAASGRPALSVVRPPRIAVLATGDEIVAPGAAPSPHQIYESGSFGVSALIQNWGGVPLRMQVQGDDLAGSERAIASALENADLLVTIGGASVGDHDLVRPALAKFNASFAVERIALRPGKPTFFATTDIGPVLGLPGNPASALVCAHLFLRSLIEAWCGREPTPRFLHARLAAPLPANGPREHYLRAMLGRDEALVTARAAEDQDSSLLSVFQNADALIRRMPNAPAASAGDVVEIVDLNRAR